MRRIVKIILKVILGLLVTAVVLILGICYYCGMMAGHDDTSNSGDTLCCCPQTTIYLQPLDNFSKSEAERLKKDLEEQLPKITNEDWNIEILPSKKLNNSLLNYNNTRYRADKLCKFLEVKDRDKTIIGLTHHDISLPLRGHKDWGVMRCVLSKHILRCLYIQS